MSILSDYPTEAADGTVHLTYFAEGVSFVWSGSAERPIQVCPGGYGEPVVARIWTRNVVGPDTDRDLPGHQLLQLFRQTCDWWLAHPPGVTPVTKP